MSVLSQDFPAPNKSIQLVKPTRASYRDLSLYHSCDYLDFVLDPRNSDDGVENTANATFGLEGVGYPLAEPFAERLSW